MAAQVVQRLDGLRGVVEQVGAIGLTIDGDAALPDLDVEPFGRNAETFGHGSDTQTARLGTPSGPLPGDLDAGPEADALNGGGQNTSKALGRAVPLPSELGGNHVVCEALPGKLEDIAAHLRAASEVVDSVHPARYGKLANRTADPDEAHIDDVMRSSFKDNHLDEAPQERLAARIPCGRIVPEAW